MLTLNLPQNPPTFSAAPNEVLLVTNADLRESANVECWPVQKRFEQRLSDVLQERFGVLSRRAHLVKGDKGHGFISSQREGSDLFAGLDPESPVIVLLTAWQYSHHLAPSLAKHRGPILLLANFDGTWPGLVGMLCMAGTLTSLGKAYSRLWSANFDDEFFYAGLKRWLATGHIEHDTSYLHPVSATHPAAATSAWAIGRQAGEYSLRHKELIGLYDTFCMGMINGVFPQKALVDIGMPMEGLSQSALLVEMGKVPQALREACLEWYEARGMRFAYGTDPTRELTREQVLEQCAMLIAMARAVDLSGKVLILDEPTASLDPRHRFLVLDVLKRLASDGVCCVFSTHEVDLAARTADDAVLLARGTVLAAGPVRQSVTERSISELFGVAACVTPLADGTPLVTLGAPPAAHAGGRG